MPKVTAPLLSFGASGQIGNAQVYSSWKGIPYARRYVVPANPKTVKQTANRAVWQMLNQAFLYAPAAIKQAFDAYAVGKPITGRNKFFSDNQKLLAVDPKPAGVDGLIMSPGNGGGLPATNLVVTPGATVLTVSVDLPDVPNGWTLAGAVAAAIAQQAPTDDFSGKWFVTTAAVNLDAVQITGLTNGTEYVVGYFLKWAKPDGSTAYSVSLSGSGTPAP